MLRQGRIESRSARLPVISLETRPRRCWSLFALVALLLVVGCGGPSYAFAGSEIAPAQPAPPLDLVDQNGQPFSWEAFAGQAVVLYFGYTTCPDACPTTLSDYLAVKEMLGDRAEDVAFVLASIDPDRDTPERMAEYLAFFDPDFVGLTGAPAEVAEAARGYGVTYERVEYPESATGYLMDHSTLSYVIDPQGKLRLTYGEGADPEAIAEDLRHLF
jgi:protein SCO1/2